MTSKTNIRSMNANVKDSNISLKVASVELIAAIRNRNDDGLRDILEQLESYSGTESWILCDALQKFIRLYLKRVDLPVLEFKECVEQCNKVFVKHKYYEMLAFATYSLARHYFVTNVFFEECLSYLLQTELIVQKHLSVHNMTHCEVLFMKSSVYNFQGNYEESTKAILQVQSLRSYSKASAEMKFKSNVNLARNYIQTDDPKKAKLHLEAAEVHWEDYQGPYDKIAIYIRKADLLRYEGKWELAYAQLQEGLEWYKYSGFPLRLGEFYKEIGEFLKLEQNPLKDYDLSMQSFEKAMEIAKELKINKFTFAIQNSMWKTAHVFRKWEACTEKLIEYHRMIEEVHLVELQFEIKKIEKKALEESNKLIKEGKMAYREAMTEEVIQLNKENEQLQMENIRLKHTIEKIEQLLSGKSKSAQNNDSFYEKIEELVLSTKSAEVHLESYLAKCDKLHPNFGIELIKSHPNITSMELKISKLIKQGLTTKSIARAFNVTVKSIENHRMNLRKKTNLKPQQSLSAYILSI
jgi:DNA-binding CsgD family transcriptional regulator/tetratricopeptide (TPR) repeat protein